MPALFSRRRALLAGFFAAAALSGVALPVAAQGSGPTLIVLVRHGEKEAEPANDPPLTAAGRERAKALLDAIAYTTPSAIFVTPTKRTTETATAVAAKFGLTPQSIPLTGGAAAHVNAVAEAVRKGSGTVVVVGHSNTIPAIIKALGGPALADICDTSYSGLFLLHPEQGGKPASLVRATYGAADPSAAPCGAMMQAR